MIRFAAVAAAAAISAVGAARIAEALAPASPPHAAALLASQPGPAAPASIAKSADGHYWAYADVDGRAVRFLVDTGATAVALTTDDARRLGIDPAGLNWAYQVSTANGEARAAAVKLASVSVAGARVEDVQAFVLDRGLPTSLLGMSYLGRLSAFEATPTSLVLRP